MVKKRKSKNENFFVRFWNGNFLFLCLIGSLSRIGILFGFIIVAFVIAAGLSDDAMWGFIIPFQIYTVREFGDLLINIKVKILGDFSKNCCSIWSLF